MKLPLTRLVGIAAALFLFTAAGLRAQDKKPDLVAQSKALAHSKVLAEWVLAPYKGRVMGTFQDNGPGAIYLQDFETEEPYVKTLRFYATMCKLKGKLDNLDKAAIETGGSIGMDSRGVSFTSVNRPGMLASSFIGVYADHTVTVNLTCPVHGTITHVTITRVDFPTSKP